MPWNSYAQTADLYDIAYTEGFESMNTYAQPVPTAEALADLGMHIVSRPANKRGELVGDFIIKGEHIEIRWCENSQRYRNGKTGRYVSRKYVEELLSVPDWDDRTPWEAGDLCEIDGEVALVANIVDDYVELLIEHDDGALESHWTTISNISPVN